MELQELPFICLEIQYNQFIHLHHMCGIAHSCIPSHEGMEV